MLSSDEQKVWNTILMRVIPSWGAATNWWFTPSEQFPNSPIDHDIEDVKRAIKQYLTGEKRP